MKNKILLDESLTEKVVKKGFWLYIFAFLIAPISYIIKIILSNNLEVYELGLIYSVISFFTILKVFNDFGINQAYNKFMPKYYIEKKFNDLKTIFYLGIIIQLITIVLISILIIIFGNYLSDNYFKSEISKTLLNIFLIYFIFQNGISQVNSIFRSFQNTFAFKFTNFIKNISLLIFILIFSILGIKDIVTYSYAWLIGGIISFLSGIIIYIKYYSKIINKGVINLDNKKIKKFFNYSIFALLGTNALIIISNIDIQMIVYFLGIEQAGIYSNYLSLIGIISLLLTPLIGFITPVISEYNSKKQYKKIEQFQFFLYKYYITSSVIISGFMIGLGKYISIILFGEKFLESGVVLEKIAIFGILNVIFTINLSILMGFGKSKDRLKILIIALIINIILNILLIPLLGILGAGFATGISWLIISIGSYIKINKFIKISNDNFFLIKNSIISFIFIIIFKLLGKYIFIIDDINRYNNLILLIIISSIYFLIFFILNIKEINSIKNNLKKIKN